jgi:hypothetical protein
MTQQITRSEFVRIVAGNEYGDDGNSLLRFTRGTPADRRKYVTVTADATRRVTFAFATPFADLGLSDRLLEMLGLSNQHRFRLNHFAGRQNCFLGIRENSLQGSLKFGELTKLENYMNESSRSRYSTKFYQAINTSVGASPVPSLMMQNSLDNNAPAGEEFFYDDGMLESLLRENPMFDMNDLDDFKEHLGNVMETLYDELTQKFPSTNFPVFQPRPPKAAEIQMALTTFQFTKFLHFYKISNDGTVRGTLPANMNPFELMYIYSDIVKPEPFDNMMMAILEIVKTEGSQGTLSQYRATSNIQYKSLDRANISNIRILIASDQGAPIPFMREPLVITLHFRRRALFR